MLPGSFDNKKPDLLSTVNNNIFFLPNQNFSPIFKDIVIFP